MYVAVVAEALENMTVVTGTLLVGSIPAKFYLTLTAHIPLFHTQTQIGLDVR